MTEQTLQKLNELLKLAQNDTITPKELEVFIQSILQFVKNTKDEIVNNSQEQNKYIEQVIKDLESGVAEFQSSLQEEKTLTKKESETTISELKKLIEEVRSFRNDVKDGYTPIKGVDYFDGADGKDGENGKDGSPDMGEDIVAKINDLPTDDEEYKIDASHIKNLPRHEGIAGAKMLSQLVDADLTGVPTDEQGNYLLGQVPAKYLAVTAKNTTGSTIPVGKVVYITEPQGSMATFLLADNSSEITSSKTVGLLSRTVANNQPVDIVTKGKYKFNGLDTSSFTEGTQLWLGNNGDLLQAPPAEPAHAVYIGILEIKGNNSTIIVDIQNGYELGELHGVEITNEQDGEILQREGGFWKNKILTKSSVGLSNVDNTSDANKPVSTATQTALNAKQDTLTNTVLGRILFGSGTSQPSQSSNLFWDNINGRLGIGTNGPTSAIHVTSGQITSTYSQFPQININSSQHAGIYLGRSSLAYTNQFRFLTGGIERWRFGQTSANEDLVYSSFDGSVWADRLILQHSTGNIGVGTTTPGYKLEVSGNAKIATTPTITTASKALVKNPATGEVSEQNTWLPRVQAVTSSASVTPNLDTDDDVTITAQAVALTLANPTGTGGQGKQFIIRIKDGGTARAITWGTNYRAIGITLPTTTVAGKTLYIGCKQNTTDSKIDVIVTAQE